MKITKKLRDVTKKEFRKWKDIYCRSGKMNCSECPFCKACGVESGDSLVFNKDVYSDKFLDQTIEIEAPDILDKEEKEYLSTVIKPFRHRIAYIEKMLDPFKDREKIVIYYRNCYNVIKCIELPAFKSELMYKNMESDRKYTLEELGL